MTTLDLYHRTSEDAAHCDLVLLVRTHPAAGIAVDGRAHHGGGEAA